MSTEVEDIVETFNKLCIDRAQNLEINFDSNDEQIANLMNLLADMSNQAMMLYIKLSLIQQTINSVASMGQFVKDMPSD